MRIIKEIPDYRDCTFVKGLHVGNISLKVYESSDKKYLIVRTKYLIGIPIYKTKFMLDNYEEAEDLVRDLKFDGRCGKIKTL